MVRFALPFTNTLMSTVPTPSTCKVGPFLTMPLMVSFVGVNVMKAECSVQMWFVDLLSRIQPKWEWDKFDAARYANKSLSDCFCSDSLLASSAMAWFACFPDVGLGLALPFALDSSVTPSSFFDLVSRDLPCIAPPGE